MTISSMDELSEWKIFICCIISSLLTGIITTYVNKRIYESQQQYKHTSNDSNSNHVQQPTTTTTHKFASRSNNKKSIINNNNNTNNKNIRNAQQKFPIPPAPRNIPSTTVTLTKSNHTSPQTYIASPNNNKNGLLSHSMNSHSEHLNLINQVVTSYPDQIARKISINNSPNSVQMISENKVDEIKRERIVIVSFKLPIIVTKKLDNNNGWHIEFENEMSFLSNLRILGDKYEIVFVGWPGIYCNNNNEEESLEDALYNLNKYRCYPIYLNKQQVELAYKTFCKQILWPSWHYQMNINDNGKFGLNYQIAWKSYCDLNCKYAKKSLVAAMDSSDDDSGCDSYIWFHGYHLLMAAQFVKKDNYICKCGLFLHTVFPTSEVFRCLPTRKEILRGMLSNDLIGFHTYDYTRHFLSSCKRILNLNFHTLPINVGGLAIHYLGRDVALRVSHIGIRSNYIKNKVLNYIDNNITEIISNNSKLKYLYTKCIKKQGRKLIISMGTLYNLKAYDKFLSVSDITWRNEVCFIYLTKSKINEKEISEIKNKYQNNDCILLFEKEELNYNELIILFRLCDIGLFANFWEGFNCGPYEYTISQISKDIPGALIISEFMGCHRSLSGVFRINPFNYELVANTLKTAFAMTSEQRRINHYQRYKHVMKHTFYKWANQFIIDMKKAIRNTNNSKKMVQLGLGSNLRLMYIENSLKKLKSEENILKLQYSFKKCKKRMLLFDFGGTLTDDSNIELNTKNKKYDSNFNQIIDYLSILSLDPQTYVGIISGAGRKELEIAFKNCSTNIILCSEKGAFWKWCGMSIGKWVKNTSLNEDIIASWKQIAYDIMKIYCDKCDGSYIQKKSTALIWHYFLCDPEYGKMQAVELERYLKRLLSFQFNNVTFQSYDHSMLLEVLPKDIHKGTAAMTILNNIITDIEKNKKIVEKDDIFMLSVGNDRSDEKMFEAIELAKDNLNANDNVFTISIGLKPTQSQYYLSKQCDILWLLQSLCSSLPDYNHNNNINNNTNNDFEKQNNDSDYKQSHTEMKYMISKLLKQQQKSHNKLSLDVSNVDKYNNNNNNNNEDNIKTPQVDHLASPSPLIMSNNNLHENANHNNPIIQKMFNIE